MPFLGSTPADKYQSLAKQTITGDGSTAYTLNRSVTNAYDMEVFINNVRQEPDTSYTASGNTITFTVAVTSGDSCYLIYQGQSVGSINPPANSVGASQVANNTITTAHLHTGLSVPDSNIAAIAASKLTGDIPHANMPAGSVIQLVTATTGSGTSVSFTFNGATRAGAIGAAITPKFANSLIFITGFVHCFTNSGGAQGGIGLELVSHPTITFINGNTVAVGGTVQLFPYEDVMFLNGNQLMGNCSFQYQHSPSSTSTIHYSVAVSENNVYSNGTSQVNWSNGTTGGRSKITLMEIAQ